MTAWTEKIENQWNVFPFEIKEIFPFFLRWIVLKEFDF